MNEFDLVPSHGVFFRGVFIALAIEALAFAGLAYVTSGKPVSEVQAEQTLCEPSNCTIVAKRNSPMIEPMFKPEGYSAMMHMEGN